MDDVKAIFDSASKNAQHSAVYAIGGGLTLLAYKKAKEVATTKVREIRNRKADDEALAAE